MATPTPTPWLTSVNCDYIQSRSISMVPVVIKKWNEDAYMPRVVSIGPRFIGREDLLVMEDVKLKCMLSFIHRGPADTGYEILEKCSSAVWELDEEVRASYVEKIELKQHELAKIMLLDGCFLLELLISKGLLDSQFPSRLYPPGPAAEVLKDEDVLSDLMLFENQIPILVLHKLSQTLFPNVFKPDEEMELEGTYDDSLDFSLRYKLRHENRIKRINNAEIINNLTLSVLGYSPLDSPCPEAPHILDIVHFYVNRWKLKSTTTVAMLEKDHSEMDININTNRTRQQLKRCALRLLTAGVTIKVKLPWDNGSTGFGALSCLSLVRNCFGYMLLKLSNIFIRTSDMHMDSEYYIHEGLDSYFEFQKEKGKLVIEQLHITKTTKATWCNIIAWENHKKHIEHSGFGGDEREHNTSTSHGGGSKFTWAALIFNGLICSEDDVKLLKDKKIIVDHLKMSNKELMEFFRKIQLGITHGVVDSSSYAQMVDDINNFSKAFFVKRIWSMVWNSFTYRQEWVVRFMNNNYNFDATLISLCTVVQTIYAIIAYQMPKS